MTRSGSSGEAPCEEVQNGEAPSGKAPNGGASARDPLLSVRDLRVSFRTDAGTVRAVDGVSFGVERGEIVCLVGESGAGKTVAAEALTRLHPTPPADVSGEIRFEGRDVLAMAERELESLRGDRIGHVFQDAREAFNPVYTVGWQIAEAVRLHGEASREAARRRAVGLLDRVDVPDPGSRVDDYPHEFSGGQLQRAGIAMALAAGPDLLVADEPTAGLDVTVGAGILRLLDEVRRESDAGVLLVTHDLGVVAEVADRVVVMYAGKVMERGNVYDVFESPAHPYTRALLRCVPGRGGPTRGIGGSPPSPIDPPTGCRFHPRCDRAVEACAAGEQPPTYPVADGDRAAATADDEPTGHAASCVHYGPDGDPAALDASGDRGGDSA
ncbi:MAG: ABC transporter ATP-binding protein [Salinigranum sp.]